MRLSRHARNRLRLIRRSFPDVTTAALVWGVQRARTVGYDDRAHRRVQVTVASASLIVVVDEAEEIIITMWIEASS